MAETASNSILYQSLDSFGLCLKVKILLIHKLNNKKEKNLLFEKQKYILSFLTSFAIL